MNKIKKYLSFNYWKAKLESNRDQLETKMIKLQSFVKRHSDEDLSITPRPHYYKSIRDAMSVESHVRHIPLDNLKRIAFEPSKKVESQYILNLHTSILIGTIETIEHYTSLGIMSIAVVTDQDDIKILFIQS